MQPARDLITVDAEGRLVLPTGLLERYGLRPGEQARVEVDEHGLLLRRSTNSLAKVYLEPTSTCNLDCATCMRGVWDEPLGWMDEDTFEAVLAGLASFHPLPSVFLGGYGEPLAHPRILSMIACLKALGAEVELITNGTLLTEHVSREIVRLELDRLWVSIDGATPASYADVRLGDRLPEVLENLASLRALRLQTETQKPRMGVAFVAMRRNIHDLPQVLRLGQRLGADSFSITNVLAHTPELRGECLYRHSSPDGGQQPSEWTPLLSLPRMDLLPEVQQALADTLRGQHFLRLSHQDLRLGRNTCPFIERASLSIRWDGTVSPCLPLLHTHVSYLDDHVRKSFAASYGCVRERPLFDIWQDPAYTAFRARVQQFDFSPCVTCNSCEMADNNQEDCFGNLHPTCGGCLWAQGLIQCP